MSKKSKQPLLQNPGVVGVLASLLSIVIGLVLGFILLVVLNPGASLEGMRAMMTTGFASMDKLGKVLYQAAPLMMCGLSVGFAFKTGLFNIGAPGQYTMGSFFALLCAIQFQLPWFVCLLAAAIGGAIWGIFPGLFKAYFNVNEVITSIMFNWIGMYLVNLILANSPKMLASGWGASNSDRTAALSAANPGAILPKGPFAGLFGNSSWINIGIILTIIFALIVWVVLQKTTFGYELKACGLSRDAAQYAGINAKRNIVLSMVIAGALSGIGGGIYYLAGTGQYVIEKSILGMGFNGIPVALLASSNPIGTIFSALFISYIQVGGAAIFVFVVISCWGTCNGLTMAVTRGMFDLAVESGSPKLAMFKNVDANTNMANNSAVFGLLVSSLWLLYFYGGTIMGGFGPFKFDSSELPIITLYAIYIPIYIALLKRKDLSGFRGKVMPVLAILCSLFMVFAAIYSHKINVVYYLIVFVVIEVIGAFFKSGRKA